MFIHPRVNLKFLLRLGISAVFLLLAYRAIDLATVLVTLKTLSLRTALLIVGLYAFGQILSSIKWRVFVQGVGIERSFPFTLRAYFLGMFVNTFGLGTIGGDVARSLALRPAKGQRAAALATVVADRIHGLMVLMAIGAIGMLLVHPAVLGFTPLLLSFMTVITLGLGWWFGPLLLKRIFPQNHHFGNAARLIAHAFHLKLLSFFFATLVSIIFHSLQIFMHFLIAHALNAQLSLGYLFATVPLVNAASTLPLSVNGIGIREYMYKQLFVPNGVSRETAVAFGAIWILAVTIVSAFGGFFLARIAPEEEQTSEMNSEAEKFTREAREELNLSEHSCCLKKRGALKGF